MTVLFLFFACVAFGFPKSFNEAVGMLAMAYCATKLLAPNHRGRAWHGWARGE